MAKFQLQENDQMLEVGWKVKLIAKFDPVAGCSEEEFWVRVESVTEKDDSFIYSGIVEDYQTYVRAHGITQGFMIQFGPNNVCEIKQR